MVGTAGMEDTYGNLPLAVRENVLLSNNDVYDAQQRQLRMLLYPVV